MLSLWITALPESRGQIRTLKLVREAMRFCNPEASAADAEQTIAAFDQHGFVHAGNIHDDHDPAKLSELRSLLRAAGIETVLNLDPETAARRVRDRALTASGATPEEVFAGGRDKASPEAAEDDDEDGPYIDAPAYETAMVLMTMTEGNPLRAAAMAHNLARTTEDLDFYAEVMRALVKTFPWLYPALVQQGMITE